MRRPLLVLAVLTLAAGACTRGIEEAAQVLETPSVTPSASATVTPSPSPSASAPPSPSAPAIVIRTPRPDDDVFSPVVVSGTAISASGEVHVRVVAEDGTELAAMDVTINCGAGCEGVFRTQLAFFAPARQPGIVQVFEVGPGGSAEHLAEVDVTLVPGV